MHSREYQIELSETHQNQILKPCQFVNYENFKLDQNKPHQKKILESSEFVNQ